MWCWRSGMAFAATAMVGAAVGLAGAPARSESYRINNVDNAQRINMRQLPSNRARVVAYIPPESRLVGTGKCNERWCEVIYKEHTGWVFRKYLLPSESGRTKAAAPAREAPRAEAPKRDAEPKVAQTQDAEAKDIPDDLRDTMLRLVFTDERPIPVYAFPSDRLPAAGRIAPGTQEVEDLGTCTRKFCYIRSGSLVGWISEDAFVRAGEPVPAGKGRPSARSQRGSTISSEPQADAASRDDAPAPPRALDNTVPTATQATGPITSPFDIPGSIEIKSYTLAGLADDAALPVRETADENSPILGWIPGNAASVEGLRKCVLKFCLVRYETLTGWVARRYLADETSGNGKRFLVSGVALWGSLDVLDYPGSGASVVGHIPAYATNLVPIGHCDKDYCHIRYLGIAGWVSAKYLAAQH